MAQKSKFREKQLQGRYMICPIRANLGQDKVSSRVS